MRSTRSFEVMSITSAEREDDPFLLDDSMPMIEHELAGPSRASAQRLNTMLALNAASVLEKTDEQLLPSVYKYVGCSLRNATPGATHSQVLEHCERHARQSVCSCVRAYPYRVCKTRSVAPHPAYGVRGWTYLPVLPNFYLGTAALRSCEILCSEAGLHHQLKGSMSGVGVWFWGVSRSHV
jgi:hypothetical protein